ncbi:MAG: long-chain fatty acid--CoA ligase [Burkholderiaceae bacterium]|nr:long-chain fatty acid--CoA ligase [Burkholderiaceae bacterium]
MTTVDFKTLPELLVNAVANFGDKEGYRYFDHQQSQWVSVTWKEFHARVMRWRKAFAAMGLQRGDRVSMLLVNSLDALTFDQAALANALVPVPLHSIDTPDSSAYILSDSGSKFLVTTTRARWNAIAATTSSDISAIQQVVFTTEEEEGMTGNIPYCSAESWLEKAADFPEENLPAGPVETDLAAIIYTSGTTGRPKGVMLTHKAIMSNVLDTHDRYPLLADDVTLSYLPLSHSFERTATYYNSIICGTTLVFSRGVMSLLDDFRDARPTKMCSVPRVFEQFFTKLQVQIAKSDEEEKRIAQGVLAAGWRQFARRNDIPVEGDFTEAEDQAFLDEHFEAVARPILDMFGGRLERVIIGGAALNYSVAKFFCALGINTTQGYGLTEYCPIISISHCEGNHPETVGLPIRNCEVRAGENDELQVRGPSVMSGYWNKPKETAETFTADGWLKTGDQVDLSDGGRVRIKGRIKEIVVTSTGEKISPVDLEFAIQEDHIFDQVMIVGEARPYITALVVVNDTLFTQLCEEIGVDPKADDHNNNRDLRARLVKRIRHAAKHFPQYGVPRNIYILREHWTPENGLLTPTMKMRRRQILERFANEVESLYATPSKR